MPSEFDGASGSIQTFEPDDSIGTLVLDDGTQVRFGLDSLIGLIPGVGDTAMLLPSLWIMAVAYKHGVPKRTIARMGWNAGVDYVVGSIPLLGDLFDLFYKSHRKNAALLRDALGQRTPR